MDQSVVMEKQTLIRMPLEQGLLSERLWKERIVIVRHTERRGKEQGTESRMDSESLCFVISEQV